MKTIRKVLNMSHFVSVLFVVVLWLPFITMNLGFFTFQNTTEKRRLVQRPSLRNLTDIVSFPRNYENYFNDNFGFRLMFISLNTEIKTNLFKTSPLPTVVTGQDGWLYYNNDADGIGLNDYLGRSAFSENELQLVKKKIETEKALLNSKGIKLLIAVAPDKQSIYPENLPKGYKKIGKSRLDQIMGLDDNGSLSDTVIDLRRMLIEAKKNGPTYYKTDTHWNKYGALVAFQNIRNVLLDGFGVQMKANIVSNQIGGGDLATLMSAVNEYKDFETKDMSFSCDVDPKKFYKILFFCDSFGDSLIPYFRQCFPDTTFISVPIIDRKAIDEIKPQIVIWEMSERYLGNRLVTK